MVIVKTNDKEANKVTVRHIFSTVIDGNVLSENAVEKIRLRSISEIIESFNAGFNEAKSSIVGNGYKPITAINHDTRLNRIVEINRQIDNFLEDTDIFYLPESVKALIRANEIRINRKLKEVTLEEEAYFQAISEVLDLLGRDGKFRVTLEEKIQLRIAFEIIENTKKESPLSLEDKTRYQTAADIINKFKLEKLKQMEKN